MGNGESTQKSMPPWYIDNPDVFFEATGGDIPNVACPDKHILLADLDSQISKARKNQTIPLFLSPLIRSDDGELISPVDHHLKHNHSPVFIDIKALAHEVFLGETMTVDDARSKMHAQLLIALGVRGLSNAGGLLVLQLANAVFDVKKYLCDQVSFPVETFDPVSWKTGVLTFLTSSYKVSSQSIGANFQIVVTSTLSNVDRLGRYLEMEKPFGSTAPIQVMAVNPVDLSTVIDLNVLEKVNSLASSSGRGSIRTSVSKKTPAPGRRMSFKTTSLEDIPDKYLPRKRRNSLKVTSKDAELDSDGNRTSKGAIADKLEPKSRESMPTILNRPPVNRPSVEKPKRRSSVTVDLGSDCNKASKGAIADKLESKPRGSMPAVLKKPSVQKPKRRSSTTLPSVCTPKTNQHEACAPDDPENRKAMRASISKTTPAPFGYSKVIPLENIADKNSSPKGRKSLKDGVKDLDLGTECSNNSKEVAAE